VALPCRVEAALGGEDPLAGYGEAMARRIAAMLLRVGIADSGRGARLRDSVGALSRRLPGRLRRDPPPAPASPESPPAPASPELALSPADRRIIDRALGDTMTDQVRLLALIDAVRHCVRRGIPGALAECGVWRGGSVVAMALTLAELGASDRDLYLYDTFEGMTAPTEHDTSALEAPALERWERAAREQTRAWNELFDPAVYGEGQVRDAVLATGHPPNCVHLVRGPVEETLPAAAPGQLALLRLDTDWYESTRHELRELYPRLASGGVLIIDDYGHWEGCRRAVDEYFASEAEPILLHRVDYTCRIAVKS